MAIAQFVHLVRSGHGGLFLDPHGDALTRIRPYLREPDLAGEWLRSTSALAALGACPGWNLFELSASAGTARRGWRRSSTPSPPP